MDQNVQTKEAFLRWVWDEKRLRSPEKGVQTKRTQWKQTDALRLETKCEIRNKQGKH